MSKTNGYATPDYLFNQMAKRSYTDVDIAGLGKFCVQTLTTSEVLALDEKSEVPFNLRVIIASVVAGPEGAPLFNGDSVEKLMQLPAPAIMALSMACNEYAGLNVDEAAVKNLGVSRGGGSH